MGLADGDLCLGTSLPLWALVATLAATVWIAVLGYRRHAGAVGAGPVSVMRRLRITALALLLVCVADPLLRSYSSDGRGRSLAVLWDCSESMGIRDDARGRTRMERAKEALRGPLEALSRDFRLGFFAFSRSMREEDGLDGMAPDGDGTDIAGALARIGTAAKDGAFAGILLVSDGADTEKGDFRNATSLLQRAGLPVYAIGVGETSLPDLAIAQVKVERVVAKDTLMRVEVAVEKRGFLDMTVPVRILHGEKVVKEKQTTITGGSATVEFEFLPPASGFLELAAEVPVQEGEAIAANNRMPFAATAIARKLKVLYMEGTNRIEPYDGNGYRRKHPDWWEHQYLVQALEEDGDVEVKVLFREPPREGGDEVGIKWVEHPTEGYPRTRGELFSYDAIICSDIEYKRFTEEQVRNTVDFVTKHGGGFVMIGGWTSFGAGGYDETPIDRILPVDMQGLADGYREGEGIMEWELTPEAWSHPIMILDKDPEKNRKIWSKCPKFHGFNPVERAKPAAVILATVKDPAFEGFYGPAVALAVQDVGRGRAMAFTSDTTAGWGVDWEEHFGEPNDERCYYKKFWKNALRWLARYRLRAPNQLVTVDVERFFHGRGDKAHAAVRVLDEEYTPTDEAAVRLVLKAPDGRAHVMDLAPSSSEKGLYPAAFDLPDTGRYLIEVSAFLKGKELGTDRIAISTGPSLREMRELSQNAELLARLARDTGGEYVALAEANDLRAKMRAAVRAMGRPRDRSLWDRWPVFLSIITLLCLEWYLRKRHGLP